jgi:hypothetical protein
VLIWHRAKGSSSIHVTRLSGKLDSKEDSYSAPIAAPFLETGKPPPPRGLYAAAGSMAAGIDRLQVLHNVAGNMLCDLLG